MKFTLPGPVQRALQLLDQAGFSAYVVGGCVRDQVLGMTPHDYDICTAATPEEMRLVFSPFRTVDTGIRHGTLTVLFDDMPLEITTFRVDGAYRDGRHPDTVRFTRRVEEDLSRRDFTMNAMAYSPREGLVDPFGGQRDCLSGVIRCVGEAPVRFEEDALRILRALRFSARLGFPIEEKTAAAIDAGREKLRRISRERVAAELNGLLLGREAGRVLSAYPRVLAEALETPDWQQGPDWDVTLRRVEKTPAELPLRWAALLADQEEKAAQILGGLKQPNLLIRGVDTLTRFLNLWRDVPYTAVNMQERLVRIQSPEHMQALLRLALADGLAREPGNGDTIIRENALAQQELNRLMAEGACFRLRQLAVNGRDLQALGYTGEAIGQTLEAMLLSVARQEVPNEKQALLSWARK